MFLLESKFLALPRLLGTLRVLVQQKLYPTVIFQTTLLLLFFFYYIHIDTTCFKKDRYCAKGVDMMGGKDLS